MSQLPAHLSPSQLHTFCNQQGEVQWVKVNKFLAQLDKITRKNEEEALQRWRTLKKVERVLTVREERARTLLYHHWRVMGVAGVPPLPLRPPTSAAEKDLASTPETGPSTPRP